MGKFDYVLFSDKVVNDLGIKSLKSPGDTPDKEANANWHVNLLELTTEKVAKLAAALNNEQNTSDREFKPKMVMLLRQGLKSGKLDKEKMKPSLVSQLVPGS